MSGMPDASDSRSLAVISLGGREAEMQGTQLKLLLPAWSKESSDQPAEKSMWMSGAGDGESSMIFWIRISAGGPNGSDSERLAYDA